jgi:hypothetical protein
MFRTIFGELCFLEWFLRQARARNSPLLVNVLGAPGALAPRQPGPGVIRVPPQQLQFAVVN